ncbi:hypothetical protein BJY00DRAFT_59574 [Aspergillus carlsbadensis]|nr:hypothetical protein BJY00DRAFT_59574 [Aspergillus carlsbadensis]
MSCLLHSTSSIARSIPRSGAVPIADLPVRLEFPRHRQMMSYRSCYRNHPVGMCDSTLYGRFGSGSRRTAERWQPRPSLHPPGHGHEPWFRLESRWGHAARLRGSFRAADGSLPCFGGDIRVGQRSCRFQRVRRPRLFLPLSLDMVGVGKEQPWEDGRAFLLRLSIQSTQKERAMEPRFQSPLPSDEKVNMGVGCAYKKGPVFKQDDPQSAAA